MMGIFVITTGYIFRPGGSQKNTQWDWSVSLSERIVVCVQVSQTKATPTRPPIMLLQRLGRFISFPDKWRPVLQDFWNSNRFASAIYWHRDQCGLQIAKNESFKKVDVFSLGEGAEFLVSWGVT
jgi:hypothetical protein